MRTLTPSQSDTALPPTSTKPKHGNADHSGAYRPRLPWPLGPRRSSTSLVSKQAPEVPSGVGLAPRPTAPSPGREAAGPVEAETWQEVPPSLVTTSAEIAGTFPLGSKGIEMEGVAVPATREEQPATVRDGLEAMATDGRTSLAAPGGRVRKSRKAGPRLPSKKEAEAADPREVQARRPQVGQTVAVAGDTPNIREGPLRCGELGLVVREDRDDMPFQVQAGDGRRWWYAEDEVVAVGDPPICRANRPKQPRESRKAGRTAPPR